MSELSDYERKYNAAKNELLEKGIEPNQVDTWPIRLMRRVGLRPRNPWYVSFKQWAWVNGILFGVGFFLLSWLLNGENHIFQPLLSAVIAAPLYGLAMAWFFTSMQKGKLKTGLTDWNAL